MSITGAWDIDKEILTKWIPESNRLALKMVCKKWNNEIEHPCELDYEYFVKNNYLSLLERINLNFLHIPTLIYYCSKWRREEILKWLIYKEMKGKKIVELHLGQILDAFLRMGNLDTWVGISIMYLNGYCSWSNAIHTLLENDHEDVVKHMIKQGYQPHENDIKYFWMRGKVDILRLVEQFGLNIGSPPCAPCHLPALQLLEEKGIEVEYDYTLLGKCGTVEMFEWIINSGRTISSYDVTEPVVCGDNISLAKWLYKNNKLDTEKILQNCCAYGDYKIFSWAFENNLDTYNKCYSTLAMHNENSKILEYLVLNDFELESREEVLSYGIRLCSLKIISKLYHPDLPIIDRSVFQHRVNDPEFVLWLEKKYPNKFLFSEYSVCMLVCRFPSLFDWGIKHGLSKHAFEEHLTSIDIEPCSKKWVMNKLMKIR